MNLYIVEIFDFKGNKTHTSTPLNKGMMLEMVRRYVDSIPVRDIKVHII